jgi:hypothetical protein
VFNATNVLEFESELMCFEAQFIVDASMEYLMKMQQVYGFSAMRQNKGCCKINLNFQIL